MSIVIKNPSKSNLKPRDMKFILKSKTQKGVVPFAYSLVASIGIVFALSPFSTPFAIALVVIMLTGSFL